MSEGYEVPTELPGSTGLRHGIIISVRWILVYFCVFAKYNRFDPETVQSVTYLVVYVIPPQGVVPFQKLRSVLEVLNFVRRFVPNFSDVTAPLVALTHKDTKPQVDPATPGDLTRRSVISRVKSYFRFSQYLNSPTLMNGALSASMQVKNG